MFPRISQTLQGTSQPHTSDYRLESGKAQSNTSIPGLAPAAEPDSSLILNVKSVEHRIFCPCMMRPQLITIQKSDFDEDMVLAPGSSEDSRANTECLMS